MTGAPALPANPGRFPDRIGPWGTAASGRAYWPLDPRDGDFDLRDIAHALARQCRFGGHCREFYSVAQHAVYVSLLCEEQDAAHGLLHDAAEAYVVDLPRPLKLAPGLEAYRAIEDRMLTVILRQFGLTPELPASVQHADELMLAVEAEQLMPMHGAGGTRHWSLPQVPPWPTVLRAWEPEDAEEIFLSRAWALLGDPEISWTSFGRDELDSLREHRARCMGGGGA